MILHENKYIEKLMLTGLSEIESTEIYDALVKNSKDNIILFDAGYNLAIELMNLNNASKVTSEELKSLSLVMNKASNEKPFKPVFNGFHNSKRKDLRKRKY